MSSSDDERILESLCWLDNLLKKIRFYERIFVRPGV
jgi:hypothetical protein